LQCSFFAVFEPFLGGLVAADVEVPGDEGDVGEVLGFVDVDVASFVFYFGDEVVAVDGILGDVVFDEGAFQ